MQFIKQFLTESAHILNQLNHHTIEKMVHALQQLRAQQGRLFMLGIGGSAANAAHAVNDFRKIVGIETYAPTDNVAELTARTNDEGFVSVFSEWLKVSRLNANDMVFILSVGGGCSDKQISTNLIQAIDYAKTIGAKTMGIVGRETGYTAQNADICLTIPTASPDHITPHTEAFQAVICHLLVSHPLLKQYDTKW